MTLDTSSLPGCAESLGDAPACGPWRGRTGGTCSFIIISFLCKFNWSLLECLSVHLMETTKNALLYAILVSHNCQQNCCVISTRQSRGRGSLWWTESLHCVIHVDVVLLYLFSNVTMKTQATYSEQIYYLHPNRFRFKLATSTAAESEFGLRWKKKEVFGAPQQRQTV